MTSQPNNLTENPEVERSGMNAPDLLSQVLAQVRLQGDHVYRRDLAAGDVLALSPGVATICIVAEGVLVHAGAVSSGQGDLILMTRGADAGEAAGDLVATEASRVMVCEFHFEAGTSNALVSSLPDLIFLSRAEGAKWLESLAFYMVAEAGSFEPGASLMISRIIDLMVIRTLRTWAQRRGGQAQGWIRGLGDARIARVLHAVHHQPFQRWTIAELTALSGMSRSSLSARFTELVGVPPLRYLAQWRMVQARDMICGGRHRVGEVALLIGYESEAAFSRAYKAEFGHSPVTDMTGRKAL